MSDLAIDSISIVRMDMDYDPLPLAETQQTISKKAKSKNRASVITIHGVSKKSLKENTLDKKTTETAQKEEKTEAKPTIRVADYIMVILSIIVFLYIMKSKTT